MCMYNAYKINTKFKKESQIFCHLSPHSNSIQQFLIKRIKSQKILSCCSLGETQNSGYDTVLAVNHAYKERNLILNSLYFGVGRSLLTSFPKWKDPTNPHLDSAKAFPAPWDLVVTMTLLLSSSLPSHITLKYLFRW